MDVRTKERRTVDLCSLPAVLALGLAFVSMATTPARADGRGPIDAELFRPQSGARGLFTVESAAIHPPGDFGAGLWLHYGRSLLSLRAGAQTAADLVTNRLTGSLVLSAGVLRWLDVSAALPVAFINDQNATLRGTANVSGLGPARVQPKAALLVERRHGVGLALAVGLDLPTGNHNAFLGQPGVVLAPTLVVERHLSDARLLLNLGYRARSPVAAYGLTIDDELFWRFGVGWRAHDAVELAAELYGATAAASPFGSDETQNPLEALVGARILFNERMALSMGMGRGLTRGYGTPLYRVFGAFVYAPHEVDTDGDGLPDRKDRCPVERGPRANQGCPWPDSDGDGLTDEADACPGVPGPAGNKGCPWGDKDGDGVLDNEDACPAVPGPLANRGCPWPDTDGDGLTDNIDACPKVSGPRENKGCPWPDRDGDGVLDKDDACPEVAGPSENKGCPWPDTDGDGVLDKDDGCPKVSGPRENKGCPWPDRDDDGVLDKDDRCPDEKGVREHQGCPPPKKVVVTEKAVEISAAVNFDSGSATIAEESHGLLDEVAGVLKKHTELRLVEVQGHTDDVGTRKGNRKLSARRAQSVVRYLVEAGVAVERLVSKGYGEDVPIVKVEGRKLDKAALRRARALNRRVQFIILSRTKKAAGDEAPASK